MRIYHNFSEGFKSADLLEISAAFGRVDLIQISSEYTEYCRRLNYKLYPFHEKLNSAGANE